MHFVPIIDAGLSYRPGGDYGAFNRGMQQDIFIKLNGQPFVGRVWPNEACYPDFFHPKAQSWWGGELDTFQQALAFDGLWQDMNEASNFCNGVCSRLQMPTSPVSYKLKYTPSGEDLETKAISLDATHYNGYQQLDAHSLFGASQVRASHQWFASNNKRTMIISRSTFAGSGKYGSNWLGDNHQNIQDLSESVVGIMQMNMFGVPLTGADICGFIGREADAQLCARWH
jgi:alpha-glucosidase (family GH31 glycosyl hydrolase)